MWTLAARPSITDEANDSRGQSRIRSRQSAMTKLERFVISLIILRATMAERTTSPRTHLRIAALGDLHVSKGSHGALQPLFTQINASADVLVLCGDFTDYGLAEEARVLARELATTIKI